ncbi:hypothetical protein [Clavibacter tessellarius]
MHERRGVEHLEAGGDADDRPVARPLLARRASRGEGSRSMTERQPQ